MLTISPDQMARFDELERARFEHRLADHLRAHFPQKAAEVAAPELLAFARHCIGRAGAHGMQVERDIVIYAGVALMLGADFDQDPQCAWAGEILSDPFVVSPSLRADLLHERTVLHLKSETVAAHAA